MGSQVIAKCECGVEAEILIGGGKEDFETGCSFPCLCESCHAVVEVNMLAEEKRCPDCNSEKIIPYDDPSLCEHEGEGIVADWFVWGVGRVLQLTNGNYKCPKCGHMSLRFRNTCMYWD